MIALRMTTAIVNVDGAAMAYKSISYSLAKAGWPASHSLRQRIAVAVRK